LATNAKLLDIAGEGFVIGGVQFKQLELVATTEKLLLKKRRARINFQVSRITGTGKLRVERFERVNISLQGWRSGCFVGGLGAGFFTRDNFNHGFRIRKQAKYAVLSLAAGFGVVAV
jgi:hypothetical protein